MRIARGSGAVNGRTATRPNEMSSLNLRGAVILRRHFVIRSFTRPRYARTISRETRRSRRQFRTVNRLPMVVGSETVFVHATRRLAAKRAYAIKESANKLWIC